MQRYFLHSFKRNSNIFWENVQCTLWCARNAIQIIKLFSWFFTADAYCIRCTYFSTVSIMTTSTLATKMHKSQKIKNLYKKKIRKIVIFHEDSFVTHLRRVDFLLLFSTMLNNTSFLPVVLKCRCTISRSSFCREQIFSSILHVWYLVYLSIPCCCCCCSLFSYLNYLLFPSFLPFAIRIDFVRWFYSIRL